MQVTRHARLRLILLVIALSRSPVLGVDMSPAGTSDSASATVADILADAVSTTFVIEGTDYALPSTSFDGEAHCGAGDAPAVS